MSLLLAFLGAAHLARRAQRFIQGVDAVARRLVVAADVLEKVEQQVLRAREPLKHRRDGLALLADLGRERRHDLPAEAKRLRHGGARLELLDAANQEAPPLRQALLRGEQVLQKGSCQIPQVAAHGRAVLHHGPKLLQTEVLLVLVVLVVNAIHGKGAQEQEEVARVLGLGDGLDVLVQLEQQRMLQVESQVLEHLEDALLDCLVLVERRLPDQSEQPRVHRAAHRQKDWDLRAAAHDLVVQRLPKDELNNLLLLQPVDQELGRAPARHRRCGQGARSGPGIDAAVQAVLFHAQARVDHLLDFVEADEALLQEGRPKAPQGEGQAEFVHALRGGLPPGRVQQSVDQPVDVDHRLPVLELQLLVGERRLVDVHRLQHALGKVLQHAAFDDVLDLDQRA